MAKDERFYIVWAVEKHVALDKFSDRVEAIEFAEKAAIDDLGHTIVVFEPIEAFRAQPRVGKIFLHYPTRVAEPDPKPVSPEDWAGTL